MYNVRGERRKCLCSKQKTEKLGNIAQHIIDLGKKYCGSLFFVILNGKKLLSIKFLQHFHSKASASTKQQSKTLSRQQTIYIIHNSLRGRVEHSAKKMIQMQMVLYTTILYFLYTSFLVLGIFFVLFFCMLCVLKKIEIKHFRKRQPTGK